MTSTFESPLPWADPEETTAVLTQLISERRPWAQEPPAADEPAVGESQAGADDTDGQSSTCADAFFHAALAGHLLHVAGCPSPASLVQVPDRAGLRLASITPIDPDLRDRVDTLLAACDEATESAWLYLAEPDGPYGAYTLDLAWAAAVAAGLAHAGQCRLDRIAVDLGELQRLLVCTYYITDLLADRLERAYVHRSAAEAASHLMAAADSLSSLIVLLVEREAGPTAPGEER